jgi:2-keto-4-pentenoate hydratase/2-oxohepta-3-ene-1,7-dioic acid hydratase in catechol pathway
MDGNFTVGWLQILSKNIQLKEGTIIIKGTWAVQEGNTECSPYQFL